MGGEKSIDPFATRTETDIESLLEQAGEGYGHVTGHWSLVTGHEPRVTSHESSAFAKATADRRVALVRQRSSGGSHERRATDDEPPGISPSSPYPNFIPGPTPYQQLDFLRKGGAHLFSATSHIAGPGDEDLPVTGPGDDDLSDLVGEVDGDEFGDFEAARRRRGPPRRGRAPARTADPVKETPWSELWKEWLQGRQALAGRQAYYFDEEENSWVSAVNRAIRRMPEGRHVLVVDLGGVTLDFDAASRVKREINLRNDGDSVVIRVVKSGASVTFTKTGHQNIVGFKAVAPAGQLDPNTSYRVILKPVSESPAALIHQALGGETVRAVIQRTGLGRRQAYDYLDHANQRRPFPSTILDLKRAFPNLDAPRLYQAHFSEIEHDFPEVMEDPPRLVVSDEEIDYAFDHFNLNELLFSYRMWRGNSRAFLGREFGIPEDLLRIYEMTAQSIGEERHFGAVVGILALRLFTEKLRSETRLPEGLQSALFVTPDDVRGEVADADKLYADALKKGARIVLLRFQPEMMAIFPLVNASTRQPIAMDDAAYEGLVQRRNKPRFHYDLPGKLGGAIEKKAAADSDRAGRPPLKTIKNRARYLAGLLSRHLGGSVAPDRARRLLNQNSYFTLTFEEMKLLARELEGITVRELYEYPRHAELAYFLGLNADGSINYELPSGITREMLNPEYVRRLIADRVKEMFGGNWTSAAKASIPVLNQPHNLTAFLASPDVHDYNIARLAAGLRLDRRLLYFYFHREELRGVTHLFALAEDEAEYARLRGLLFSRSSSIVEEYERYNGRLTLPLLRELATSENRLIAPFILRLSNHLRGQVVTAVTSSGSTKVVTLTGECLGAGGRHIVFMGTVVGEGGGILRVAVRMDSMISRTKFIDNQEIILRSLMSDQIIDVTYYGRGRITVPDAVMNFHPNRLDIQGNVASVPVTNLVEGRSVKYLSQIRDLGADQLAEVKRGLMYDLALLTREGYHVGDPQFVLSSDLKRRQWVDFDDWTKSEERPDRIAWQKNYERVLREVGFADDEFVPPWDVISSAVAERTPFNMGAVTRERVDEVVNAPKLNVAALIALLREIPEFSDLWDVVVVKRENLTLEQHTALVLQQFERYHAARYDSSAIPRGLFRIFLALHDAGKAEIIKAGRERIFEDRTAEILQNVFTTLGYSQEQVDIARALLVHPVGYVYLRGVRWGEKLIEFLNVQDKDGPDAEIDDGRRGTVSERILVYEGYIRNLLDLDLEQASAAVREINEKRKGTLLRRYLGKITEAKLKALAGQARLSLSDFVSLCQIYNQVDAGAYTTDASGAPQVDGRYSVFDDVFEFDRVGGRMGYKEPYATYISDFLGDLLGTAPVLPSQIPLSPDEIQITGNWQPAWNERFPPVAVRLPDGRDKTRSHVVILERREKEEARKILAKQGYQDDFNEYLNRQAFYEVVLARTLDGVVVGYQVVGRTPVEEPGSSLVPEALLAIRSHRDSSVPIKGRASAMMAYALHLLRFIWKDEPTGMPVIGNIDPKVLAQWRDTRIGRRVTGQHDLPDDSDSGGYQPNASSPGYLSREQAELLLSFFHFADIPKPFDAVPAVAGPPMLRKPQGHSFSGDVLHATAIEHEALGSGPDNGQVGDAAPPAAAVGNWTTRGLTPSQASAPAGAEPPQGPRSPGGSEPPVPPSDGPPSSGDDFLNPGPAIDRGWDEAKRRQLIEAYVAANREFIQARTRTVLRKIPADFEVRDINWKESGTQQTNYVVHFKSDSPTIPPPLRIAVRGRYIVADAVFGVPVPPKIFTVEGNGWLQGEGENYWLFLTNRLSQPITFYSVVSEHEYDDFWDQSEIHQLRASRPRSIHGHLDMENILSDKDATEFGRVIIKFTLDGRERLMQLIRDGDLIFSEVNLPETGGDRRFDIAIRAMADGGRELLVEGYKGKVFTDEELVAQAERRDLYNFRRFWAEGNRQSVSPYHFPEFEVAFVSPPAIYRNHFIHGNSYAGHVFMERRGGAESRDRRFEDALLLHEGIEAKFREAMRELGTGLGYRVATWGEIMALYRHGGDDLVNEYSTFVLNEAGERDLYSDVSFIHTHSDRFYDEVIPQVIRLLGETYSQERRWFSELMREFDREAHGRIWAAIDRNVNTLVTGPRRLFTGRWYVPRALAPGVEQEGTRFKMSHEQAYYFLRALRVVASDARAVFRMDQHWPTFGLLVSSLSRNEFPRPQDLPHGFPDPKFHVSFFSEKTGRLVTLEFSFSEHKGGVACQVFLTVPSASPGGDVVPAVAGQTGLEGVTNDDVRKIEGDVREFLFDVLGILTEEGIGAGAEDRTSLDSQGHPAGQAVGEKAGGRRAEPRPGAVEFSVEDEFGYQVRTDAGPQLISKLRGEPADDVLVVVHPLMGNTDIGRRLVNASRSVMERAEAAVVPTVVLRNRVMGVGGEELEEYTTAQVESELGEYEPRFKSGQATFMGGAVQGCLEAAIIQTAAVSFGPRVRTFTARVVADAVYTPNGTSLQEAIDEKPPGERFDFLKDQFSQTIVGNATLVIRYGDQEEEVYNGKSGHILKIEIIRAEGAYPKIDPAPSGAPVPATPGLDLSEDPGPGRMLTQEGAFPFRIRFTDTERGSFLITPPDPEGIGLDGYRIAEAEAAIRHIRGGRSVVTVSGQAGQGKTTFFATALKRRLEQDGKKVLSIKLGHYVENPTQLLPDGYGVYLLDGVSSFNALPEIAERLKHLMSSGKKIVLIGSGSRAPAEQRTQLELYARDILQASSESVGHVHLVVKPFNRKQTAEILFEKNEHLSLAEREVYLDFVLARVPALHRLVEAFQVRNDHRSLRDVLSCFRERFEEAFVQGANYALVEVPGDVIRDGKVREILDNLERDIEQAIASVSPKNPAPSGASAPATPVPNLDSLRGPEGFFGHERVKTPGDLRRVLLKGEAASLLGVGGRGSRVGGHGSRVTGHESRVTGHESRLSASVVVAEVTSREPPFDSAQGRRVTGKPPTVVPATTTPAGRRRPSTVEFEHAQWLARIKDPALKAKVRRSFESGITVQDFQRKGIEVLGRSSELQQFLRQVPPDKKEEFLAYVGMQWLANESISTKAVAQQFGLKSSGRPVIQSSGQVVGTGAQVPVRPVPVR